MEISVENGAVIKVSVAGTISTIEDSDSIVTHIKDAASQHPNKEIHLVIEDSYIILSRLIGSLLKLIKQDNLKISMFAGEENLVNLLKKLGLDEVFNVRKIDL